MNDVFSTFVSSFLGSIADFLLADPIIYFVSCFLILCIIGIFRQLIYISR